MAAANCDRAATGPPRQLDSNAVVDGVLRRFASDLLRRYGEAATGGMAAADFMEWLERECRRLNDLFMGVTAAVNGYAAGPWNSPDQMGHHVRLAFGIDGDLRLGVRDALMVLARGILRVADAHAGKPAEVWGPEMDRLVDNAVRVFLGGPPGGAGARFDTFRWP